MGQASATPTVRRLVSHHTALAAGTGERQGSIGQPAHFAATFATLGTCTDAKRTRIDVSESVQSVCEVVTRVVLSHGEAETSVPVGGRVYRASKRASTDDGSVPPPPVGIVEATATLVRIEAPAGPESVPELRDAETTDSRSRRLHAAHAQLQQALQIPLELEEVFMARPGYATFHDVTAADHTSQVEALRHAAATYIQQTSVVQPDPNNVPRRLHGSSSTPEVLFDVSMVTHADTSGYLDVPLEHDPSRGRDAATVNTRRSDAITLDEFVQCVETHDTKKGERNPATNCMNRFYRQISSDDAVLEDTLDLLEPEAFEAMIPTHAHAPQALLHAVAAVGTPACQHALTTLLLTMEHRVPAVKSFSEAHGFYHTVTAISEVAEPSVETIEALFTAMDQHKTHLDQYHQLLLTLGTLGRELPDGPLRDRVRSTLEYEFDEALNANRQVEARFASHLAVARALVNDMTPTEWHMWLAHVHHMDRTEWERVWQSSPAAKRDAFEASTLEALARIVAEREHGEHDGYGVWASYHQPARRLRPNAPRYNREEWWDIVGSSEHGDEVMESAFPADGGEDQPRAQPGDSGHHRALLDVTAMQAPELQMAMQALSNFGDGESGQRIVELLAHRKRSLRSAAAHALRSLPSQPARRALLATMADPAMDPTTRQTAADSLSEWPSAMLHVDGGFDVVDAVLEHLADNDGMDWDVCAAQCAETCHFRNVIRCHNSCTKECTDAATVETALVALLVSRFGHMYEHVQSTSAQGSTPDAASVLARAPHGVDASSNDGRRLRGARRLFNTLGALEGILSNMKFTVQGGFNEGWKLEIGVPKWAYGYIGAELKDKLT